jgi:minichromosome maintenance protein 10
MDDVDDLKLLCSIADDVENDNSSPGNTNDPENSVVEDNGQNEEATDLGKAEDIAVMAAQMKDMQKQIEMLQKKLEGNIPQGGKPKAPPPHQQTQPSGVHVHVQKRALKQIQDDESGVVTDVFSGLRLKNALVSPALMKERMAGRQMVRLSRVVESNLASLKDKDWVTIGVLVDKLPPKETSKGDKFAVWKLSDLSSSSSILVFFLFKDVYQKHWKTPQGQVVALLNPDKMQSKEGHDNVAITIDHPHKMMILGTSKDLAVCSGKNSKTGRSCRNYINKSQGDYCEFHVQAAYKKARACRMECQKG